MPAPTGAERAIYKSALKKHDVTVNITLDKPYVDSSIIGTNLLSRVEWYKFVPEGTNIVGPNSSGALLTVTDAAGVLRPASIWSKEGLIFPVDKTIPWTLTWTMRFNYVAYDPVANPTVLLKTYLATAFRVCGIDNTRTQGGSIIGVDGNLFLGTRMGIPDGNWVGTLPVTDTAFHTYTLAWDGTTYTFSSDYGSGTLPGGIGGVVTRGADFISIGVPGITSNVPAIWTEIEVSSISITGSIGETITYPSWVPPGVSSVNLPGYSVLGGRISVDKDNDLDTAEITLSGKSPNSTTKNIFQGFDFQNRPIIISSVMSDTGGNSTSSKRIFQGIVDEIEHSVDDQNGVQITLRARDVIRRKMQRTFMTKSYADFTTSITGIPNSMSVSAILQDIINTVNQTDPADSISATIQSNTLKPKTLNFINQTALSAFQDLCEDVVYEVYVTHKGGGPQLFANQYTYTASGTANYDFSVYDEIILVSYAPSQISQLGQVEMTFENANNSPFFAVYPVNRWPGTNAIIQRPSRIIQEWEQVAATDPFHVDAWRRENRDAGSIIVTMPGQDWLEMNLNVTVFDDIFLGLTLGTIFMIDGWEYEWNEQEFITRARLVRRRPQDFMRSFL